MHPYNWFHKLLVHPQQHQNSCLCILNSTKFPDPRRTPEYTNRWRGTGNLRSTTKHLFSEVSQRQQPSSAYGKLTFLCRLIHVRLIHKVHEQLLHRNVQRFRGGLAFKAHRLCVSSNSRLESNKEEEGRAARGADTWYLAHTRRHLP